MQDEIKLAIVGSGVVGQGILYAWIGRGYQVDAYDVNPATIEKLRNAGVNAYDMGEFGECDADLIFICISTPRSEEDGSIYLEYMRDGLNKIGPWITKRVKNGNYPMIVMRSTMLPTLSREEIIPHLEEMSGLTAGQEFGYAHLPEILRETDALDDSENIWQVVIGKLDDQTALTLKRMFEKELGSDAEKLISIVPVEVAEAAKVIVNTLNATVISYFNMMGSFLRELQIDGQQAIDLAVRMGEASLNCWYGTASGFPYGGKCLPKDVAALLAMARARNYSLPQLHATQLVNDHLTERAELGEVPKPVIGGFRRASAKTLRQSSLAAYDNYQAHL